METITHTELALAGTMFTAYSAILFGIAEYLRKHVWGSPSWEPIVVLAIGGVSGLALVPGIARLSGMIADPPFGIIPIAVYVFLGVGAAAVGESAREQYRRWRQTRSE